MRTAAPATDATIPDLPQAVALLNLLVHAYATVNDKVDWEVVEQPLTPLCDRLKLLPSTED